MTGRKMRYLNVSVQNHQLIFHIKIWYMFDTYAYGYTIINWCSSIISILISIRFIFLKDDKTKKHFINLF